jgi:hypothetical protein
MLVEDISRNKYFFQVQISHVLWFTSICDLFTDSPLYMGSSYMVHSDGRGDFLGAPFLSKFDVTSLFGATVSSLMPI